MSPTHVLGGPWALVPAKRLDEAKSRLSGVLSPARRRALAEAMLRDVLAMLGAVAGLSGTLVVTGDPLVATLAQHHGMGVLPDPHEAGTNAAACHGLTWLAQTGAASAVVVPGDIPFARAGEVETVIQRLVAVPVVLVPAARDGGTNMLGIAPPDALPVAFGEESFARHRAAAAAAGLEAAVLALPGAGRDIDVPGDLREACGRGMPPGRTSALLDDWRADILASSLHGSCPETVAS